MELTDRDYQQVRREVENLILQFEQIADWVVEIDYEGQSINVREFLQRVISRYQLEREESIRQKLIALPVVPQAALAGSHILTVEDNEDISTLLAIIFQTAGAEVTSLSSASKALDLLKNNAFTAVVSDIGMPEMSGLEFMRRLRARGDRIPGIALSAFATSKDEQAALDAGFDLFVSKPVHPARLVSGITRLMQTVLPTRTNDSSHDLHD